MTTLQLAELDEDAFTALLRFPAEEAERRKALILERGQHVRVEVQWLGNLLALVITPLEGFTHLIHEHLVEEATRRYGPYHVSLIKYRDFSAQPECAAAFEQLQAYWDGWEGWMPIAEIRSAGYLLLAGAFAACPYIELLHSRGQYSTWGKHISA